MPDAPSPTSPDPQTAPPPAPAAAPSTEEWKPEPRQWSWKDLFTTPMLAFKPRCMVVSFVTIILVALLGRWAFQQGPILFWILCALMAVVLSLGATLVSIFFKADLLDDEFLSYREALTQFKGRLASAVLVPLFMVGILAGFAVLRYLLLLGCSIPGVGPLMYALCYLILFLVGLFSVLLVIGVVLSAFVGPSVIAIRKHGWFDNVIDTFEAVGTKPHFLALGLLLTGAMMLIGYVVPHQAMEMLTSTAASPNLPGWQVVRTQERALQVRSLIDEVDPILYLGVEKGLGLSRYDRVGLLTTMRGDLANKISAMADKTKTADLEAQVSALDAELFFQKPKEVQWAEIRQTDPVKANLSKGDTKWIEEKIAEKDAERNYSYTSWWHRYITGPLAGLFQLILAAAILGYLANVFLAGGMLSYLCVREDDYWDDEDLEDLDKLAKELEEEAKQEEAKAKTDATPAAAPAPAAEAPKVDENAETRLDIGSRTSKNGAEIDTKADTEPEGDAPVKPS